MADILRTALFWWYDSEKRELPWRSSKDPYAVWVSETMLQQTTVAAVVPFFKRWMSTFPTVRDLAGAREEDVLALWQGLGYYRRAKNLLAASREVVERGWPSDMRGWLSLPGVGKYTAGAICSICYGQRVPAVDGNVERVYARVNADRSPALKASAIEWAQDLADCERPGDVNQALMDLGATICRPRDPLCSACPITECCLAFSSGSQAELPIRVQRRRPIRLQHRYIVPLHNGLIGVRKFEEGEWWSGMYGFPKMQEELSGTDLGSFVHFVTNHRIEASARLVRLSHKSKTTEWRSVEQLNAMPMPAPHRKILNLAISSIQDSRSNATGTAKVPSSAKK